MQIDQTLPPRQRQIGLYRDELKGLAILWVVFFHSLISCTGVLADVQKLGYGGVDIFFFLTGYGLYHSLQKSDEPRAYWSRRLWRLLPAYLPLVICWMLVMGPSYQLSTVQGIRFAIGNLSMVGYWLQTPEFFNWYVSGLLLCVALAPVCFAFLTRSRRRLLALVCLLSLGVLCGFAVIGQNALMPISRLPVFLLGMAFAMEWRTRLPAWLTRLIYALSFAAGLAVVLLCFDRFPELLLDYGMYWYPFALITPPLCAFVAFLFRRAERIRAAFAPLRLLGQSSFEIYLLNIWMVEICKRDGVTGDGVWLLLCLGNLAAGVLYHLLIRCLIKRARSRRPAL